MSNIQTWPAPAGAPAGLTGNNNPAASHNEQLIDDITCVGSTGGESLSGRDLQHQSEVRLALFRISPHSSR